MSGKVYKCLNPVGIQMPVKQYPLAPRLGTLDGKNIHLSICGEPDITIPLEIIISRAFCCIADKLPSFHCIRAAALSSPRIHNRLSGSY